MSKDDEFAEYMKARWRPMLRAAVLLGCGQPEAEDLVQATFTRCYVKWDKVTRADNRNAYVSRMLSTSSVPVVVAGGGRSAQPLRSLTPSLTTWLLLTPTATPWTAH